MAAPVGHPADSGSLLASRDSELSARFVNDVLLPTAALAICRNPVRLEHQQIALAAMARRGLSP